jgi:ferredoxin-NADP reductase
MQLTELTQLAGIMLAGAASMRAAISVISIAGRKYHYARQEKKYVSQFQNVTAQIFRDNDIGPKKATHHWQGKRKFRVVSRAFENINRDICSFYLEPNDGRSIPQFRAGQFLTFSVPVPGQAEPVIRCYSLSDGPDEQNHYRVTVKKIDAPCNSPEGTPPGRSSSFFHNHMQPGAMIDVYSPTGSFCLDEASEKPVVLIAGGVGITPLVSMLKRLIATKTTREIWLIYGVRNKSEHAMYEYLQTVARETYNLRTIVAYSKPSNSCRHTVDYHVRGHITEELLRPILEGRDCDIYLCGPAPMMKSLTGAFKNMSIPDENIRFEAFGPASRTTTTTPAKHPKQMQQQTFLVEFARSGKKLSWLPGSGSILELAMANGIKARCGCRQGVCGTCAIALQNGSVKYERRPDKSPPSGKCLPCIAYPQSDLVLDM